MTRTSCSSLLNAMVCLRLLAFPTTLRWEQVRWQVACHVCGGWGSENPIFCRTAHVAPAQILREPWLRFRCSCVSLKNDYLDYCRKYRLAKSSCIRSSHYISVGIQYVSTCIVVVTDFVGNHGCVFVALACAGTKATIYIAFIKYWFAEPNCICVSIYICAGIQDVSRCLLYS